MDKKLFGAMALIVLLGAGCSSTGAVDSSADANTDTTSEIVVDDSLAGGTVETGTEVDLNNDMVGGDADPGTNQGEVKEFTVEGGNFAFTPSTMTVKKGDTVRITFKNMEGFHDFVIDEFDVKTQQIQGGTEETVEFVADEAGTFEYYCSVGKHREMGMKGTLTVTE